MAASPVDEGLTIVERQALELQEIVRVYMSSPDHSIAEDVLAAVEGAVKRLGRHPKLAKMFLEMGR